MDELGEYQNQPLIDLVGDTFSEAMNILCKVGLNDANLFLRWPIHLSDGQLYRFKLAQLLDSGKEYWICDEFCSILDRTTAKIVAFNIQKLARRADATLIVATTHTDLFHDLNPSVYIRKGWGSQIEIEYGSNEETTSCSVIKDIEIRESDKSEYNILGYLHYRSQKAPIPMKFYALTIRGELIGIIVYSYAQVFGRGRKQAAGRAPKFDELNQDWVQISRVIIHPLYRSIGLGAHLIRETLPLIGKRHVELMAVMAQYNPFAEKAGMRLILRAEPTQNVVDAIKRLERLGFNPYMMSSTNYSQGILDTLSEEKLEELKDILVSAGSQYYRRLSRKRTPYVKQPEFKEWLSQQDSKSLAWTLQTLSTLGQTKAYYYWCRDWLEEEQP